MKTAIPLILLLLAAAVVKSLANGGPVDGSGIYSTAGIKLINKSDISLTDEDLKITIDDNYCIINVRYKLKNSGPAELVKFGFPVDFNRSEVYHDYDENKDYTNLENVWDKDYILNFNIKDGTKKLKTSSRIDNKILTDTITTEWDEKMILELARKWYLAELSFKKDEEKTIHISYKIKSGYSDAEYSKSFFREYSDRSLIYDLCPASYWGDGTIRKLNIEVNAKQPLISDDSVYISGLQGFSVHNGIYKLEAANFDPAGKKLKIRYWLNNKFLTEDLEDNIIDYSLFHAEPSIYSKDSRELFDGNLNTGITMPVNSGDSMLLADLIFDYRDAPYMLTVVAMLSGELKDSASYADFSRVKEVRIEVNFYNPDNPDQLTDYTIEFDNKNYHDFNKKYFFNFLDILFDRGDPEPLPVKRLKIYITDVYPGNKQNTLYIPELYLLGLELKKNGNGYEPVWD